MGEPRAALIRLEWTLAPRPMDDKARRHAAEERAAQQARAAALAHLKKTGAKTQSEIVQPVASSRKTRMRKMDNTMELVRKRKAAAALAAQEQQQQRQQQRQNSSDMSVSGSDGRAPVSFTMAANKRSGKKRKVDDAWTGDRQMVAPALPPPQLPLQPPQAPRLQPEA